MSQPFNVLVTDFLDHAEIENEILGDIARFTFAQATEESGLAPYVADADAMLAFHDIHQVGEASFARASRCRGVVRAGVGFNNIDIAAAGRHGIPVCNIPDYGTEDVADHAILMLLALTRKFVTCHQAIRDGGWDVSTIHGAPRLRGRTLGIVGCGRIGTAAALRGKAFGMDVIFYDPNLPQGYDKALGLRRATTLHELMAQSHFVSCHCYLDESSYHLIDADALRALPPGGFLVNTARGPVVEQEALLAALDSGHLAGAGLDVLEREPLDDDRIRSHPKILLTPHAAFYTVEGYLEMRRKGAEEVRRLLLGQPPRCLVNRQYLTQA